MRDEAYERWLEDNDQLDPTCWTINMMATQDVAIPHYEAYWRWLVTVQQAIGAGPRRGPDPHHPELPWALGDPPREHGRWRYDHFGFRHWDTAPWAIVWQRIEGVASLPMALCWAAIHLVQPLTDAGFTVHDINAEITGTTVAIG